MPDQNFDIVVIGGGIVGLATALQFGRAFPRLRLLLVEKEDRVARHQSGHNSGVIHSGIYYKPGSLKAKIVRGRRGRHGCVLPRARHSRRDLRQDYRGCQPPMKFPRLQGLFERGQANGIAGLKLLDKAQGARDRAPLRRRGLVACARARASPTMWRSA